MYKNLKNVKIFAENVDGRAGFNVYLDFSGQREFLVAHRKCAPLFLLLKNGMRMEELERWNRANRRSKISQKLSHTVAHLITIASDYIDYEYITNRELAKPVLKTKGLSLCEKRGIAA